MDDEIGPLDLLPTPYQCPFCGETVEILLDWTGGPSQEFTEDCPVCCQPAKIRVQFQGSELTSLDVSADD